MCERGVLVEMCARGVRGVCERGVCERGMREVCERDM